MSAVYPFSKDVSDVNKLHESASVFSLVVAAFLLFTFVGVMMKKGDKKASFYMKVLAFVLMSMAVVVAVSMFLENK